MRRVIDAPSESCDALPAVTVPSSSNAGGSPARPSIVLVGRLHSSRLTTTSAWLSSPVSLSTCSMVAGIDFASMAIKLPGLGTWPMWQRKRPETWIARAASAPEAAKSYAAMREGASISRIRRESNRHD